MTKQREKHLKMVQEYGRALRLIEEQTPEIIQAAKSAKFLDIEE